MISCGLFPYLFAAVLQGWQKYILEMQCLTDTEADIFHTNIFQSGAVLKIVHILTADKIMAGSEEQIHSTSFQVVLM